MRAGIVMLARPARIMMVFVVVAAILGWPSLASTAPTSAFATPAAYGYDAPSASTTHPASTRTNAPSARPGPRTAAGSLRFVSGAVLATKGAISMDEAVTRAAAHVGGKGEMVSTARGNYQFVGMDFTNSAGDAQRNIGRFDIQNLRRSEGPHLNLEVQINGVRQRGLDPHAPIDPFTMRPGDFP